MRGQVLLVNVEEESDVPLTSNDGVDIVLRAETVGEGSSPIARPARARRVPKLAESMSTWVAAGI